MYTENEFIARRDEASDDFIRRMLEDSNGKVNVTDTRRAEPTRDTWGLHGYPLAMVYSPIQEWRDLYDNETGLSRGTIFKELELPFMGGWNDGASPTCGTGCGGKRNG